MKFQNALRLLFLLSSFYNIAWSQTLESAATYPRNTFPSSHALNDAL